MWAHFAIAELAWAADIGEYQAILENPKHGRLLEICNLWPAWKSTQHSIVSRLDRYKPKILKEVAVARAQFLIDKADKKCEACGSTTVLQWFHGQSSLAAVRCNNCPRVIPKIPLPEEIEIPNVYQWGQPTTSINGQKRQSSLSF